MPSPTTALQIIQTALGLTNAVGVDQTLTAAESDDSLRAFNDLIEIFNTNNLAVYGLADQSFNTVVGTGTYTFGTGGTWSATRPVRINDPAYSTINGVTFPCMSMTQGEYDLIAYKAQTQDYPNRYLYVNGFPLATLTLFPVPSAVTPVTFSIDQQIAAVATVGASISFPPGYSQAFTYQLAVMLAGGFGVKMARYPEVQKIATDSFASICRANHKKRVMRLGPEYGGSGGGGGNALGRFLGGY